ncbi:hypothetical protein [Micrococcus luteus]|uniref:hypothetical protein n=1 Tax=Micrococcus luteus TaxID=1270 RepID=UPI00114D2B4A|nr:hypothetical protein [Micrococcus luteus]
MNIPNMEERRPLTPGTASNHTDSAPTTDPNLPPILPDSADLVAGVFVLVVIVPDDPEPRHRRRTFFSLKAAERAAARAVTRGHRAEVVLCRLVPETYGGETRV